MADAARAAGRRHRPVRPPEAAGVAELEPAPRTGTRRRTVRPPETARGLRRWLAFNAVGTLGVAVQLAVLVSLTEGLGLDYRMATVLAVESAILHNFAWHERWTWRDRGPGPRGRWTRLAWFNLVTGALSISANVVFTALYVRTFGVHYALANLLAIASCSLLTFLVNDRFVFSGESSGRMRHDDVGNAVDAGGASRTARRRRDPARCGVVRGFRASPD